jgi:hypothetical protein
MANKHRKVWKVVSGKLLSGKQTWPKLIFFNIKKFLENDNIFKRRKIND